MTTTGKGIDKQKVFAYLRKSTKKVNQEQSIIKQKAIINGLAKKLGLNTDNIEYFIDDGYSGYKGSVFVNEKSSKITRQRKEFTRLIKETRAVKVPCKILVWNYSRLTRNFIDYTDIYTLLGNNYNRTVKVEGIYFSNDDIWTKNTSQSHMIDKVNESLKYSEDLSIYATERHTLSLVEGRLPNDIKPPKGLENTGKVLKETWEMEFIIKAFEMKAEGNSNKDIHNYLKRNKVTVNLSRIADRLFKNRVYLGEYTLKATEKEYTLKFYKNKKPIGINLFNKANGNVGLKKGKYGRKQVNDLLANLLKTEEGRKFTGYIPTNRKAKQYLNDVEGIYVSQNKIFNEFTEIIYRICYLQYNILVKTFYSFNENNLLEIEKIFKSKGLNFTDKIKKEFFNNQIEAVNKKDYVNILKYDDFNLFMGKNNDAKLYKKHYMLNKYNEIVKGINKIREDDINGEVEDKINKLDKSLLRELYIILGTDDREVISIVLEYYSNIFKKSYETLREMIINNGNEEFKIQKKQDLEIIRDLEKEIKDFENIIEKAKNSGILNGFTKEEINIAIKGPLKSIENLKEEIDEINSNSLNGEDLDRFIGAIQKIFEHTSNMLGQANNGVKEEDYLHLIKLVTFELVLNTKKKLKIKLFKGIDKLLFAIGTPKENGTPVPALRRPYPNH